MDEKAIEDDLSRFFSTYGVITAQRILGWYQIRLPQKELSEAVRNPSSFYHKLLQVPLRNVLNGIILQQANEYQLYLQKLFIDYLLSPESSKEADAPGHGARQIIEDERKAVVALGEAFSQTEDEHAALIARSQSHLIQIIVAWRQELDSCVDLVCDLLKKNTMECKKSDVIQGVEHALIHCDLNKAVSMQDKYLFIDRLNDITKLNLNIEMKGQILECLDAMLALVLAFDDQISEFFRQVREMGVTSRAYRTQFYDTVIRVYGQLNMLADYRIDPAQDAINRESLYFDKSLGDIFP